MFRQWQPTGQHVNTKANLQRHYEFGILTNTKQKVHDNAMMLSCWTPIQHLTNL